MAVAPAMKVLAKAWMVTSSIPNADPALKPNQPNHRIPAPIMVKGRLWGSIGSFGQPLRLPRTRTKAREAAPAATWTTVPPAKSRLPRLVRKPPSRHTQDQVGTKTSRSQTGTKTTQAENFNRSATAPEIRAGVMQAKVRPKKTSRRGLDPSSATWATPSRKAASRLPSQVPVPSEDRE